MLTLREKFEPIKDRYNKFLNGEYLSDLLQMKGGTNVGTDYVSKVFKSQFHAILEKHNHAVESVRNPTINGFYTDNIWRFVLGNVVERLICAYQAYPILQWSSKYPGTYSHTFTEIMNEGVFKGTLKGSLLYFLQPALVLYPSILLTNKSDTDFKLLKFVSTYIVLDALTHPIDTLRTFVWAETHSKHNIITAFKNIPYMSYFKGLSAKFLFNIPYASALYLTSQHGSETSATFAWLLTALLYPLNTYKVREQLANTAIGNKINLEDPLKRYSQGAYRGVGTFLVLNMFLGWTLTGLFNQAKLDHIRAEVKDEIWEKLGKHL